MDNNPNGFVAGFLHFVLKFFLAAIALIFAACLLGVGLLAMMFSLLKALVTWRKPAPWVVFRQVQKYSARNRWHGSPDVSGQMSNRTTSSADAFASRDRHPALTADVVDLEVRELPETDIKR